MGGADLMVRNAARWYQHTAGFSLMEKEQLQERISFVESKREYLLRLLEKPNLGTLRVDVNQALEELDDLIAEFKRTFPDRE